MYQSQALQHHSLFLLLSLDEMCDIHQDHLGLKMETLLTDKYQLKGKLVDPDRRFRAAQEDSYLLRQDKSKANVIISRELHPGDSGSPARLKGL